jgi:hypothetical protein
MRALRRRWGIAVVTLSAGALLGGCPPDKDVVADVQKVDAAIAMMEMPDAGSPAKEPPCELAPGWFAVNEIVNTNGCRFKVAPQLLAWIQLFSARGVPPPGEERGAMLCEAAGLQFYPDPLDETQGIICEATCKMIKDALAREEARYRACGGEDVPAP